jgi:aromatic-L-amino-acid decarboxylase
MTLLERLNDGGEVFLTHTTVGGNAVLRVAVGSPATTRAHVERVWTLLREGYDWLAADFAAVAAERAAAHAAEQARAQAERAARNAALAAEAAARAEADQQKAVENATDDTVTDDATEGAAPMDQGPSEAPSTEDTATALDETDAVDTSPAR